MAERFDAHMHLFRHGYESSHSRPSEVEQYIQLSREFGISAALVVGYEGQPWAIGNSRYLAQVMDKHKWVRATAFVARADALTTGRLSQWQKQGFVGISMYLFEEAEVAALAGAADGVWSWLAERRWLISVNSSGRAWGVWRAILRRHPDLRLIISHLGLPPAQSKPPSLKAAARLLASVTDLAKFPGVHVKLSGFYGVTKPEHDYPHRAAWPYAQVLIKAFGARRLLWGSDFSPAMKPLSFPQTIDVLKHLPGLSAAGRRQIEGDNLRRLLDEVKGQTEPRA